MKRADAVLFWFLTKLSGLDRLPGGHAVIRLLEPIASPLMRGYLRREAKRLDAHAARVAGLDDETARALRQYAAEYREQARGLD